MTAAHVSRASLAAALRGEAPALDFERSDVDAPAALRFRLYTVDELGEIPDPEPLVAEVLYQSTFASIVAKFASYKSFVALDLALHIAHGLDWHGHAVTRGAVVYIYAEGARSIRRRVESWRLLNQLPDVGGIYFLPQAVLLNDPRDGRDLLSAIAALPEKPLVLFVDTVARTIKGNESLTEEMGEYITACDRIREQTGMTVCVIHHMGWEGTRSRGSNSLPAAVDTELTLTRDGERVSIKSTKQKDGTEREIVTLEAVSVGESIAFKRFGLNSPKLSANERRALAEVQEASGLRANAWEKATDLGHSSFQNARKRLVALLYVRLEKNGYCATESGRLALGPTVQGSPNAVQTDSGPEVQIRPIPLGMDGWTEPTPQPMDSGVKSW
ncbi:hypothetical protein BH11GEM2_BH11GEM2_06690 [soil metagenome]